MSIEQRLEQVERQTKRLRIAVVVLATALCGVVSMAATESNNGYFDEVYAKRIWVQNDKDGIAVALGESEDGNGIVNTYSSTGKKLVQLHSSVEGEGAVSTYGPTGKKLVTLHSTVEGNGMVSIYNGSTGKELVTLGATVNSAGAVSTYSPTGKELVTLGATVNSEGAVSTYGPTGKKLVALVATPNGGAIEVTNKTGEGIIQLSADDYGNGEVGVWNRKGKGRVWRSQ